MAVIKVECGEMLAYEAKLDKIYDEMDEVLSELDKSVEVLKNSWEGDSAEAFFAQYEGIVLRYKRAMDYMMEFKAAIEKTLQQFNETDAAIRDAIRSIH